MSDSNKTQLDLGLSGKLRRSEADERKLQLRYYMQSLSATRWLVVCFALNVIFNDAQILFDSYRFFNDLPSFQYRSTVLACLHILVAFFVLIVPASVPLMAVFLGLGSLKVLMRLPQTYDHALLELAVYLVAGWALLVSTGQGYHTVVLRLRNILRWTAPVLMLVLLFHRLNDGFLEKGLSCAFVPFAGTRAADWISESAQSPFVYVPHIILIALAIAFILPLVERRTQWGLLVGVLILWVVGTESMGLSLLGTGLLFARYNRIDYSLGLVPNDRSEKLTNKLMLALAVMVGVLLPVVTYFFELNANGLAKILFHLAMIHLVAISALNIKPLPSLTIGSPSVIAPLIPVLLILFIALRPYAGWANYHALTGMTNLHVEYVNNNHLLLPNRWPLNGPLSEFVVIRNTNDQFFRDVRGSEALQQATNFNFERSPFCDDRPILVAFPKDLIQSRLSQLSSEYYAKLRQINGFKPLVAIGGLSPPSKFGQKFFYSRPTTINYRGFCFK